MSVHMNAGVEMAGSLLCSPVTFHLETGYLS